MNLTQSLQMDRSPKTKLLLSLVNQIVNQNRYSMVPIRISFLGITQMEALVLTSILPLKMDTQLVKVSTE